MPRPTLAALLLAAAPAAADLTIFDNGEFALRAIADGGVLEPPIPLYLDGTRIDDPATGGSDFFSIIDLHDRVPGTGSYPLTAADIIANGYVRPLVQRDDGSTTSIGTSVITGPSFRPAGEPLDLIPLMFRADVATHTPQRFDVRGRGTYNGRASLDCRRAYPDPAIGRTEILVTYTWTADEAITLAPPPAGRGFDAFRLCMLSSMLADLGLGQYDANYLAITDPQGRTRTIALTNPGAPQHLFPSPRPTAVGRSFALLKDRQAAWNPLSPSVEVEILGVGGNIPAPPLGVNAWISGSTNPNDDSLNVWLEWLDAPATLAPGATLEVSLRIIATPATDPGDLDHDQDLDCRDLLALDALLGVALDDPTFDAYADLDHNGLIDEFDRHLLVERGGTYAADLSMDGDLTVADFTAFREAFLTGAPHADFDGDGLFTVTDFTAFRAAFLAGCP